MIRVPRSETFALDSNQMATPARIPATMSDLVARRDHDRLEIIAGEIVEKATPSPAHAMTEFKLAAAIDPFNRRPGSRPRANQCAQSGYQHLHRAPGRHLRLFLVGNDC